MKSVPLLKAFWSRPCRLALTVVLLLAPSWFCFLPAEDLRAKGLLPKNLEARRSSTCGEKCSSCAAHDVWKGFVEHMKAKGHEDLIPPEALKELEEEENKKASKDSAQSSHVHLESGDPIRGILFRVSPDLLNLDSLFETARLDGGEGKPLDPESIEKARGLVEKLRASDDPYLKAYADFYGARIDLQAKSYTAARKPLEELAQSPYFLPRREARRYLALAYEGLPDETLAVLELQFFLLDLPEENESDRVWAEGELKRIRDKKHPGPLHDSEDSMRSISTLLAGLDVGSPTQTKERRVEDILDKVAKLLDRKGGT